MEGAGPTAHRPTSNCSTHTRMHYIHPHTQQCQQLPDSNTATGWPRNNAHKGMPQTVQTWVYMQCGGKGSRESTRPDYAVYSNAIAKKPEWIDKEGDGGGSSERDGEMKLGQNRWEITKSTNTWLGGIWPGLKLRCDLITIVQPNANRL